VTDTSSASSVRSTSVDAARRPGSERSAVAPRLSGTVRVVGAGLLGASVGHALRAKGIDVVLTDSSPAQLRLAVDYGAGRLAAEDDRPRLIVVAVPPDVTADVVQAELAQYPDAVVTDVASVKLEPFRELQERGVDLARYIGSHPLAGRDLRARRPLHRAPLGRVP
jgi:prephenate dehydrogenase